MRFLILLLFLSSYNFIFLNCKKKDKKDPKFSNFATNDKQCKGYIGVITALDNSAKEIIEKIIKPYKKNNKEEPDDKRPKKIDYIENQIRTYLPRAMQKSKKIKNCFYKGANSVTSNKSSNKNN